MKTTPCIAALLSMLPLAWVCGQSNTVGTIAYDPALYADGYTLIYPHNQPHARLIDACGEVVHMWTNDSLRRPGNSAYLTPMGSLIWAHRPANFQGDAIWAGGGGAGPARRGPAARRRAAVDGAAPAADARPGGAVGGRGPQRPRRRG